MFSDILPLAPSLMNLLMLGTALLVVAAGLAVALADTVGLASLCQSDYATPWYSPEWSRQPVTNALLATRASREYWTGNVSKTERWLVRETEFCNKTFWTILDKRPAGPQGSLA